MIELLDPCSACSAFKLTSHKHRGWRRHFEKLRRCSWRFGGVVAQEFLERMIELLDPCCGCEAFKLIGHNKRRV